MALFQLPQKSFRCSTSMVNSLFQKAITILPFIVITLLCVFIIAPGEDNGNPLQYSHLENPTDGGAGGLQSMGPRSWTRLSDQTPATVASPQSCPLTLQFGFAHGCFDTSFEYILSTCSPLISFFSFSSQCFC